MLKATWSFCTIRPMWFKSYGHFHLLNMVKMYKYARFGQNLTCSSRGMSIFTKRSRPFGWMLGEAWSPVCIQVAEKR